MRRRELLKTIGWSVSALALKPTDGYCSERSRTTKISSSEHFDVLPVSESVYAIRGKPLSGIAANTAVIVGDTGVAVVDTHQRPSYEAEVIHIIRQITSLPIQYLVNTHWHQDHTLGNQAYEGRAKIVAHANTSKDMRLRVEPNLKLQLAILPSHLRQAQNLLREAHVQGKADDPEFEQLAQQVALDSAYLGELQNIHVVPPDEVFHQTYDLDLGRQPIQLLHVGAGHTRGDIVVFLPEEGTLIFGDLLTAGQPFMRPRDAVPSEWGPTLMKLKGLNWDNAVPGHGWVDQPRDRIEIFISYLNDLTEQVRAAILAEVSSEEITRAVSLDKYAPYFPYFKHSINENIRRTFESLAPY